MKHEKLDPDKEVKMCFFPKSGVNGKGDVVDGTEFEMYGPGDVLAVSVASMMLSDENVKEVIFYAVSQYMMMQPKENVVGHLYDLIQWHKHKSMVKSILRE